MRIMSKIVAGRLCLASLSMSSPSDSHRRISRSLNIPRCVIVQPSLITFPPQALGTLGALAATSSASFLWRNLWSFFFLPSSSLSFLIAASATSCSKTR